MKQYTTAAEALTDMHERGFTSDFQLVRNHLWWVQQKTFISPGMFAIVEYHRFWNPSEQDMDLVLFGVILPHHNAGGILFIDYATHPYGYPPVIIKKMNDLNQTIVYRGNIENERFW